MAPNNSLPVRRQKQREFLVRALSLEVRHIRRVVSNKSTNPVTLNCLEMVPMMDGPSDNRPPPCRVTSDHRPSLPMPVPVLAAENKVIKRKEVRPGLPISQNKIPSTPSQLKATKVHFPPSDHDASPSDHIHEWMAKFCIEPPRDGETCALGTFIPCALMGKTDWRLNQREFNQDPLDSAWKSSYGCNITCWGLALLMMLGEPMGLVVLPIYAILQRKRVRNIYDIHSNSCQDCAIAWFCTRCSIIQVDREVRAREGEARLRTNKRFILEPVVTQPSFVEPMRYVSPRPILERQITVEDLEASKEKGWITQVALLKRQAALKKLDSEGTLNPSSSTAPGPVSPVPEKVFQDTLKQNFEIGRYSLTKPTSPMKPFSEEKQQKGAPRRASKPSWFGKQKTNEVEKDKNNTKHDSKANEEHKLRNCGAYTIFETQTLEYNTFDPLSKMTTLMKSQQHNLADCATSTAKSSVTVPIHNLADCSTRAIGSAVGLTEHTLFDCHKVSSDIIYPKPRHRLASCVVMESEGQSQTKKKELSYIHDFSDCPVNKGVLEYIEKEEIKDKQHQAKCRNEHRLSSCPNMDSIRQRSLGNEHRSESCFMFPEFTRDKAKEHRVVSCPGATVPSDKTLVSQHRIESCPTFPISGGISHRPSLENTDVAQSKGKDKKHVHTEQCLKGGAHHKCPKDNTSRKSSLTNALEAIAVKSTHALDAISTAVKSFQSKANQPEEGPIVVKPRPKRHQNHKGKAKVIEVMVSQNQRPKEDSAQASLQKLLASSQRAKQSTTVNIDVEQQSQTVRIHTVATQDGQEDGDERTTQSQKRPKTWADTLGFIFGESRNVDIGS